MEFQGIPLFGLYHKEINHSSKIEEKKLILDKFNKFNIVAHDVFKKVDYFASSEVAFPDFEASILYYSLYSSFNIDSKEGTIKSFFNNPTKEKRLIFDFDNECDFASESNISQIINKSEDVSSILQLPSSETSKIKSLDMQLRRHLLSSQDWCQLMEHLPNLESLALYQTALPLDKNLIALLKSKNIQSLTLTETGDDGTLLKVMLEESILDSLTQLTIMREFNFTPANWEILIDRLPNGLQEIEINDCFIQKTEGASLGTKLGDRPIRKFSLNYHKHCRSHLGESQKSQLIEGYKALWHAFGQTELKHLESMTISDEIPTGPKEHCLTVGILNKCLQHGHILPTREIGFEGELNKLQTSTWQNVCMVFHCKNLLSTLNKQQIDSLPLESWSSYFTLVEEINKLKTLESSKL